MIPHSHPVQNFWGPNWWKKNIRWTDRQGGAPGGGTVLAGAGAGGGGVAGQGQCCWSTETDGQTNWEGGRPEGGRGYGGRRALVFVPGVCTRAGGGQRFAGRGPPGHRGGGRAGAATGQMRSAWAASVLRAADSICRDRAGGITPGTGTNRSGLDRAGYRHPVHRSSTWQWEPSRPRWSLSRRVLDRFAQAAVVHTAPPGPAGATALLDGGARTLGPGVRPADRSAAGRRVHRHTTRDGLKLRHTHSHRAWALTRQGPRWQTRWR